MELEKVNLRVILTEKHTDTLGACENKFKERNRFCQKKKKKKGSKTPPLNLCNKLRSNFLEATFL